MKKRILLFLLLLGLSSLINAQITELNNGNIGIGVADPKTKLHINGGIRGHLEGGVLRVESEEGNIDLGAQNNEWAMIYTNLPKMIFNKDVYTTTGSFSSYLNDLVLKTTGKERMVIDDFTGNVGVGTSNPLAKLHVNGSIRGNQNGGALRVEGSYGFIDIGAQNSSFAHIYTDRSRIMFNRDLYLRTGTFSSYDTDLVLKTKGISRFVIDEETGNVGIGAENPDSKLVVSGNILAREIKVTATAGGADFVFANDYDLPSLKKVEKYIKRKKHLPEIASAKEMEKKGINLANMNIKLLQKIEELTLYTIAQEKKINDQEKRLERIEKLLNNNQ